MFFYKLIFMLLGLKNGIHHIINRSPSIIDKKIITISPGGYKGFYQLGICKYIKEHYDLTNYVFSGASAGAWVSLVFCFKKDFSEIQTKVLDDSIMELKTMQELENKIINKILTEFTTDDFDLERLYIGTTTLQKCKFKTTIYHNFTDLEDALNCCRASSHIPLITAGIKNVYRNVLTFDGGFSKHPYLRTSEDAVLHITPSIWSEKPISLTTNEKNKKTSYLLRLNDYTTVFSRSRYKFNDMVNEGYKDSENNKEYLDNIFKKIG